jgi:hypothetical protein
MRPSNDLDYNTPSFKNDFKSAVQIKVTSGDFGKKFPLEPSQNDSNMLPGYTLQLNNILAWPAYQPGLVYWGIALHDFQQKLLGRPFGTSLIKEYRLPVLTGAVMEPARS